MTREEAAAEFKRCRPWLEAALEHCDGQITIDDVIQRIAEGRMHFWPGKRCACVTELAVFPHKRYLNVTLAGGDMDEILSMVPSFQAYARALGCEKVTEAGRPGWEKVLRARGWKKELVVLSIPVEGTATGG